MKRIASILLKLTKSFAASAMTNTKKKSGTKTNETLPHANLFRIRSSNQGTEGLFVFPGFYCCIMELPWRDNQKNRSCIPAGTYHVRIRISPKFGEVYWVMEVPDRKYILVHAGNWAGDVEKKFKTHTYGCLLTGKYFGLLAGQRAVLLSRITLKNLMDHLEGIEFEMTIHENFRRAS